MMRLFKSLTKTFWITTSFLYLMLSCILIYFLAGKEYIDTQKQIKNIRSRFITTQKELIKDHVQLVIDYVDYKKKQTENRVREDVRQRGIEAYNIASALYRKHKKELSLPQIKKRVYDALSAASWDSGKGYYFAQDSKGISVINKTHPEYEGRDVYGIQDPNGIYIGKLFTDIALSSPDGGYCSYYWVVPDVQETAVPKISYVIYFEPFDWVIGNGKYLLDEEKRVKKEVIERIEKISYGENAFVFAGTFEGISLSGLFKGENLWEFTDSDGLKVVQKLVAVSKQGGGFVQYVSPESKGQPSFKKISYVGAVDQWNWYIGSGVQVDAIETVIREKQTAMKKKIQVLVIKCITAFLLFWTLSFLTVGFLSKKIHGNLVIFSDFFRQSAEKGRTIDAGNVVFTEFKSLAKSANLMAEDRKKSMAALKKNEEKYRHLFNNTPAGVYEIDLLKKQFLYINDYLCDYVGYSKEELLSQSPLVLLTEKSRKHFLKRYEEVLAQGKLNDSMEFDVIKKNGEIFTAVFRSEFIYQNDIATGVMVVVTDISKIKKMEALMIQSEKMLSLGGLAAGMAHEINNPLAGMIQNAQVIRQRLKSELPANKTTAKNLGISMESIQQYMEKRNIFTLLGHIAEAGGRAAKIIENILSFARKTDSSKKNHDIIQLIDQTIELAENDFDLKKSVDFKQIKIIRQYSSDCPNVRCDSGKIQQVLLNLLKNASESMAIKKKKDYTPTLILRVKNEKKKIRVEIEDNGRGMDAVILKQLFEPFFTTKSVDKGTGLGLSISYFIIVDDHGGTLEVESTEGVGSTFIIMLPA